MIYPLGEADLQIALVGPAVWQEVERAAVAGLEANGRRLASSIVTTLHDRHLGITPRMAAAVARLLPARSPDDYPRLWRSLDERLRQTLRELAGVSPQAAGYLAAEAFHLRLNVSFPYVVFHLVAPLVQAACLMIGRSYLFSEDEEAASVTAEAYEAYAADLKTAVANLIDSPASSLPALFWEERALALAAMTRRRAWGQASKEGRVKPVMNPPDLALFLRLGPQLKQPSLALRRPLLRYRNPDVRTRRLPDAGTEGIHLTQDPAEIHRMLLSEWLHPEELRLDRMVNSGFLATQRPPRRVRLRDALIVGLLPETIASSPAGSFLKTCWFEFMMQVAPLLRLGGMNRSELRWIEGGAGGRLSSRSLLLDELSAILPAGGEAHGEKQRHTFRVGTGWLPAYLDEHVMYEALTGAAEPPKELSLLKQWLWSAWRAQKENRRWRRQEGELYNQTAAREEEEAALLGKLQPLDSSRYAFVHLLLFVPTVEFSGRSGANPPARAEFCRLFGGGNQRGRFDCSLVIVSSAIDEARESWGYLSGSSGVEHLLEPTTVLRIRPLAEALIGRWLQTIIRELKYG